MTSAPSPDDSLSPDGRIPARLLRRPRHPRSRRTDLPCILQRHARRLPPPACVIAARLLSVWPGRPGPALARQRRPRGATPGRLPDYRPLPPPVVSPALNLDSAFRQLLHVRRPLIGQSSVEGRDSSFGTSLGQKRTCSRKSHSGDVKSRTLPVFLFWLTYLGTWIRGRGDPSSCSHQELKEFGAQSGCEYADSEERKNGFWGVNLRQQRTP
jgi:hypothetical protein